MNAKQMAALCSMLGLMLSGAAYADSAMSGGKNQSQMPMFEQGTPIMDDQVMSNVKDKDGRMMFPTGINYPGRIDASGTDFFVTGSFIYWMASTDGFNVDQYQYNAVPAGVIASGPGTEVFVSPNYKPGFKAGIGFSGGCDDWAAYLEYTWLHQNNHTNFSASGGSVFFLAGSPYNIASDVLSTKWKLDLDVLDFTLSRAYYVGKRVIVEPFGGLRGAWIRQKWNMNLSSSSPTTPWALNPLVTDTFSENAKANSWGLGARLGAHSEWLIGGGFRLDAKASGSLLFTRYQKLTETTAGDGAMAPPSVSYYKHYDVMRANAEMGLGLGWGCYLGSDDGFHLDLVATYDFNIWWSQNMLRGLFDTAMFQTGNYPTDLMYHGPTLTLRLDF